MGNIVDPAVYLIAETRVDQGGLEDALTALGVGAWTTDAKTDAELLTEFAGKSCYLSFDTSLNKNLTKTGGRNNYDYIQQGIVGTKHGSVLEHSTVTFFMHNVSRVVTHELVRHRPGTAFSQVSGRYVRTDKVDMYYPQAILDNTEAAKVFAEAQQSMEHWSKRLSNIFKIDEMTDFNLKKKLTSAFRRLIGNGQANHIVFTANHRALRHVIEQRTNRHAEEEIRLVFEQVWNLVRTRFPAIYADGRAETVDGILEVIFGAQKI